ncbi:phage baseplate assembly protein V [Methyloterricola oryzae]|uniref:phage baseplate assembly protein V n=1 Tax=Methyloterricola oryzae TaxID=1495050 RepID=UPI0005EBCD07|nr:phage baseplate assembly protein V [Methyloterricola oryzae]
MKEFFGKYRGQVAGNVDPMEMGRVQVTCPAVLGPGRLSWALPAVPYGGQRVGLYAIPPVGANIWVEFEGGDPDSPIWAGCFWGSSAEMPVTPAVPETKVFRTGTVTLTMSDLPGSGGFTLEVLPPSVALPISLECKGDSIELALKTLEGSIRISADGIHLTFGGSSVDLSPISVNVNKGALEVI